MKIKDLNTLTIAQLLEIYNTHANKSINRFSDRKAAIRRVKALLEKLATQSQPKIDAPTPVADTMAHRVSCCAVLVSSASAPAKTTKYSSVLVAFRALKLPVGAHKRFRRALKLAGVGTINGYLFAATYKGNK